MLTLKFADAALCQLMVVPPYAAAALFLIITSYISDKIRSRGLFIVAGCTFGGLGYLLVTISSRNTHDLISIKDSTRGHAQSIYSLFFHVLCCHWNIHQYRFDIGMV